MLEEIIVTVDDRPGVLAEMGELLGASNVNIETFCATTLHGGGLIHLVVDDGEDAAEILASNGFKVEAARPVMTTTLDDRPGELGRYCRKLTNQGIGISAAYVIRRGDGETELLFAVDEVESSGV
jgi:hypothetical protein